MPITDKIVIETSTVAPVAPPPDTARTFAMVAPAVPAGFTERVQVYSSIGELDDAGWSGGEVAYKAAARLFEQAPVETTLTGLVMVRRDAAVAEEWTIDVTGNTDGDFKLFDAALEITTFTAAVSTPTEIKDGLVANTIAGYTAASTGATTFTVTNDVAGVAISLTQSSPAGNSEMNIGAGPTIPAVGIYDDLDAAFPLAPFWGALAPGATDAENDEARRWAQADRVTRRNFVFAESVDAGIFDIGDVDNLAVAWLAGAYDRVNLFSHTVATDYPQAAMVGRLGGGFPGSRAFDMLPLSGITTSDAISPRSSSATTVMIARRVSYSERQLGPTSEYLGLWGFVPKAGEFIYHRWVEDYVWYLAQSIVYGRLISDGGVNLTEVGLQGVISALKTGLAPLLDREIIANLSASHTPIADVPPGEIAVGDFKTTGAIRIDFIITPKLRELRVSVFAALAPT